MTRDHRTLVDDQFGPRAAAYVESSVHAEGRDLDRLDELVRGASPAHALDLGTGGGHVAYRLAKHARRVTACDLSADMLAAVAKTAVSRGLGNIETVAAPAERLPFADAAFDFLACRFTAHHWRDFEGGLRQARRVLAAGAPAVFIDAVSPGPALLDTHLQAIELLRDTSHCRNYTPGEWTAALGRCGFAIAEARTWRLRMDFPVWIARMATPEPLARAILALQGGAPAEVRRHFAVEADGSFMLDMIMLETSAT